MRKAPNPRARIGALATAVASALAFGACGDGGGSGAGGRPSATTTTTAPASTVTAAASSSTGDPFTCDDCTGATAVCVDDALCAATCPLDRARCPSRADGGVACCDVGETCCTAEGAETTGPGTCVPAGQGCPVFCPDGSTCAEDERCRLDAATGAYGCIDDCDARHACGASICCPLGTQCEAGACALPDISIDEGLLSGSVDFLRRDFASDSCSIVEGCIDMPGSRRLLRFSLGTPNTGEGDLFLGNPADHPDLFEYSSCHDHFHFTTYARYELRDMGGAVVATGHKQAFCLLDFDPLTSQAAELGPRYDCTFQGIQKDWMDTYDRELPCQWVDVTDVAPGDYMLSVELNYGHLLAESDYANNAALVPVTIPVDACPGGCGPEWDDACCAAGDPCGWGQNQRCDCGGYFEWDSAACTGCPGCTERTSCEGGCAPVDPPCCGASDTCGNAGNGVCDCAGAAAWDVADCAHCVSADVDCTGLVVDSCPQGCFDPPNDPCCTDGDPCGYAADGACDCGQAFDWDTMDCSSCPACN